jgi:8-oxo-dGTP diphosphatase
MKRVVNAIIFDKRKEKFLLIKRKEGIHPNKWAFPGGILKRGETIEQALKREVKEEVGLEDIRIIKKMSAYEYLREDKSKTKGECWLVYPSNTKVLLNVEEALEFSWVSIEELENLDEEDCCPGIKEEAVLLYHK